MRMFRVNTLLVCILVLLVARSCYQECTRTDLASRAGCECSCDPLVCKLDCLDPEEIQYCGSMRCNVECPTDMSEPDACSQCNIACTAVRCGEDSSCQFICEQPQCVEVCPPGPSCPDIVAKQTLFVIVVSAIIYAGLL